MSNEGLKNTNTNIQTFINKLYGNIIFSNTLKKQNKKLKLNSEPI